MSESSQHQIHLIVPRAKAARWIRKQIDAGRELKAGSWLINTGASVDQAVNAATQWLDVVRQILRSIFDKPDIVDEWRASTFAMVKSVRDVDTQVQLFNSHRDTFVARLEGVLKRLPYFEEALPASSTSPQETTLQMAESKVFIVHGHDTAIKEAVARFLMKLDIRPVILDEEPNAGRTIIEKLEQSLYDGFAVVLMTPDDVGGVKDHPDALKPRARQNVILELGYFIGLLGRDHVCALYRSGVELPSDYLGVVYTALDDGGAWQLGLARELKTVGFDVDLNKVL